MKLETVTFSPIGSGWDWTTLGFGMITIFGLMVLIYQFNSKRKANSSEISNGSIIIMVILATAMALGAGIYSLKSNDLLENVEITATHIRTPFGSCKMENIKSVYIFPGVDDAPSSNPTLKEGEKYLIIEEVNGHRHPLSSEVYPIEDIYKTWKELSKR